MIKKNVTITEEQETWIKSRVASGLSASDSDVIQEAIRQHQEREEKLERIREAIREGEESGISEATPESIRRDVLDEMRRNGRL